MLRKLLTGAAVTAASAIIAASAQAAEWDIEVGGYYNAMVSYAQNDYDNIGSNEPDFDGVDIDHGGEFYFQPSITLDNGIKIGADIALEGFANDSVRGEDIDIDEAVMFISGSFGTILLGSENSAGYNMHIGAPNVFEDSSAFLDALENEERVLRGETTEQTEYSAFIFEQTAVSREFEGNLYRHVLGTTQVETEGHNDAIRMSYFTPRFAGFQIGVSYARDGERDEGRGDCNFRTCDYFDVGANYLNSFGDFDVALSGRWGTANAPENSFSSGDRSDPDHFGFGVNLGFGGFRIGGSFAEVNESSFSDESQEGQSYDIGASYSTGPWSFSATYFHGEQDYKNSSGGSSYNFANEGETDQFTLGVDYKLAKGVRLNGFGSYVDYSNDSTSGGSSSSFGSDGFVIGTGIGLSF